MPKRTKSASQRNHGAPHVQPKTVEEALGSLTEEKIRAVPDQKVRAVLEEAYAFARGVAAVFLADPGDADTEHTRAQLATISVTLDDAMAIAAACVDILDGITDRDRKESAYHVAVARVRDGVGKMGQELSSFTLLLRGKLGAKSPALKRFGVMPLARGGRRANAKAAEGSPAQPGTIPAAAGTAPAK